jgi:oligosaccharide repeat unit polymerase
MTVSPGNSYSADDAHQHHDPGKPKFYLPALMAEKDSKRLSYFSTLLAHPSFPFGLAWTAVLLLNECTFVDSFSQYRWIIRLTALGILIANFAGAAVTSLLYPRLTLVRLCSAFTVEFRGRGALLCLWILLSLCDCYVSGGLPLLWVLQGTGKTYEDFGIHSLHGFANALWLYLTFSTFVILYEKRSAREGLLLIVLIAWTVVTLSRASFSVIIFQALFYYVLRTRQNKVALGCKLLLAALVFSIAFGYAGNSRVPEFSIASTVGRERGSLLSDSGLWIYTYLISPSANLAFNIATQVPDYSFPPRRFLSPVLPSVLRRALGMDIGFNGHAGVLAHEAFNVGTGFWEIYLDLGVAGIAIYSFLIGACGHVLWRSGTRSNKLPVITYFGVCAALSVFSNQFLQLPVIMNLLLLGCLVTSQTDAGKGSRQRSPNGKARELSK